MKQKIVVNIVVHIGEGAGGLHVQNEHRRLPGGRQSVIKKGKYGAVHAPGLFRASVWPPKTGWRGFRSSWGAWRACFWNIF